VLSTNITQHGESLESFTKKKVGVDRFYTKQIQRVELFFKELTNKINIYKKNIFEELNTQKCLSNELYT